MIDSRFRRFVEIVAAEHTRGAPHLFDDCVQEGMIAAWRAWDKDDTKAPAYYRASARNGVRSVVSGRSQTGHEGRRGWQDAHKGSEPLLAPGEDGGEAFVFEPSVEAPYGAVEIQDAVREAVRDLPDEDRLLVWGRYWEDRRFQDLSEPLGRPTGTLQRRWTEIVRPVLREKLEHLVA